MGDNVWLHAQERIALSEVLSLMVFICSDTGGSGFPIMLSVMMNEKYCALSVVIFPFQLLCSFSLGIFVSLKGCFTL